MKKLGKITAWVLTVLAVVAVAAISFTIGWRPFIGARSRTLTARKFDSTPARLVRGAYLVNNVTDCMGCHAEHDWTSREAPILPGTLGSGQDIPRRALATGQTINWHVPFVKESVTTVAPCSRSCLTRISTRCRTKTSGPSSFTCGRCRPFASSGRLRS